MEKKKYPNIDTITKAKVRRFNLSSSGLCSGEVKGLIHLEAVNYLVNHRYLTQKEFDTSLDFVWESNPLLAEHICELLWHKDVSKYCNELVISDEIARFRNLFVNASANTRFLLLYFLTEDNIQLARKVFNQLFDFIPKKENTMSNESFSVEKQAAFKERMFNALQITELVQTDPMDLAAKTILDAAKDMTSGSQAEVIGGLLNHNRNVAEAVLNKLFAAYKLLETVPKGEPKQ